MWVLLLLQLLTVPYLLMNTIGKPVEPGIAPYATAMSGILFTSGIAYVIALAAAQAADVTHVRTLPLWLLSAPTASSCLRRHVRRGWDGSRWERHGRAGEVHPLRSASAGVPLHRRTFAGASSQGFENPW